MYLLDRYEQENFDEETFINFVDALISLTFRAKICGNAGITSQFAGNVIARLDRKDSLDTNFFWSVVTFGKGRYAFPSDRDFQAALVNNNLYETIKGHGCKYLLYSLEHAMRPKELPDYSEPTVEHILPQTLKKSWKDYLEARDDLQAHEIWRHTLGNLTLTSYNSELNNADFDSKKEIYAQSNYFYTRALADYSEWTSRQIQTRAKKLAASAIKIWTLPEEYNATSTNTKEVFNLDSDFGELKGAKPATLFIADAEIKMPHWSHLLREIVRQLYALDKFIFRQATQLENVPQSLFKTEPTCFQLDKDFFMETGFSTADCLRYAKILVENFDSLSGTNFKEDIYFTIKS